MYTNKNIILLFLIKYSYLSQIYRKCKADPKLETEVCIQQRILSSVELFWSFKEGFFL